MLNLQVIEKPDLGDGQVLEIHHIFRTIQGEGPFVGTPAIFIRMAGCNLQCPLCDTDYTSQRSSWKIDSIITCLDEIAHSIRLVVITGGEPFRQNIEPLVHELINRSYEVQVETNGTLWVAGLESYEENLTIVCSPKAGKINRHLEPHIAAYKYILHADHVDKTDGLPLTALNHTAEPRVARPPADGYHPSKIYVQPVDVGDHYENARHLQAAIMSCMEFGYTLCIQTQKIIGLE